MAMACSFMGLTVLSLMLEVSAETGTCGGQTWVYPSRSLCWNPNPPKGNGIPAYHCMWYTLEQLSDWPNMPRAPALTCNDINIDCEHSLICTVLLEYQCRGSSPCWGTDADRKKAEDCLRQRCPAQAAAADQARDAGTPCPVSNMVAGPKVAQTLWNGMYDAMMPHVRMASKTPLTLIAACTGGFVALVIVAAFAIRQRRRMGASMVTVDSGEEDIE